MRRILVVEDEPGIALALQDSLRLEGYEVDLVTDGSSARRRAATESFDLLLLDVMIAGGSGFDVCRDLRQSGIKTPIIFLSARALEEDRVRGLDLGANDYVVKPFSSRALMARVRGLLRQADDAACERRQFDSEMCAASTVQRRLFPQVHPIVPGLDYVGVCRPARRVSGDCFDFISLHRGRFGLLLADVCGKGAAEPADVHRFGDLEVDLSRCELRQNGRVVDITPIEFKLLTAFVRNRGRVVSRQKLLDEGWGAGTFLNDRVIDNHIVSLRRKIETDPANPRYLVSVRGIGYRFDG